MNNKDPYEGAPEGGRGIGLSLAALGIVYGDIGTSPLYAVRECFFGASKIGVTEENVLGILSLIFWALILIVSVKYLLLVMRADNRGEGGVLALLALLEPWGRVGRRSATLVLLGVFGAALLYGDGMLTPTISVLSAVEGLEIAAPAVSHLVIPVTIVILILLFSFQKRGTAQIGAIFGPIMLVWFCLLAVFGIVSIAENPHVLIALNPLEGVSFMMREGGVAFVVLGGVFLVVTGGEALYADMGHFGRRPIRIAWFALVLPALVLNYFGQGAFILEHTQAARHPFYNLVPHWAVFPMIAFATVVTVIASQAVISGTYSLVRQAIQLGQSPQIEVIQTSAEEIGQIYVPLTNWVLMFATIALVLSFKTSSNLAAAYGVAVSSTMVITSVLMFFVMRDRWKWPPMITWSVTILFFSIDMTFMSANLFKVADGGWFPLVVGCCALLLMRTWDMGKSLLRERTSQRSIPIDTLLQSLALDPPARIPGTAVFLTSTGDSVPNGLLHHLKLNTVLHENVILMTAITKEVPRVPASHRFEVQKLTCGFYRVYVNYGFMQSPNLSVAVKLCQDLTLIPSSDSDITAYYADRITLHISESQGGMAVWRKRLFAFMMHNSQRAVEFYRLPPGNSVELGIQVEF